MVDLNNQLLHAVRYEKSKSDVKTLLKKGAKASVKDHEFGMSALLWAVCNRCYKPKLIDLLLANGASIQEVDFNGWNVLHYAVATKADLPMIHCLLDKRANILGRTTRASGEYPAGSTVVSMARQNQLSWDVLDVVQKATARAEQQQQQQAARRGGSGSANSPNNNVTANSAGASPTLALRVLPPPPCPPGPTASGQRPPLSARASASAPSTTPAPSSIGQPTPSPPANAATANANRVSPNGGASPALGGGGRGYSASPPPLNGGGNTDVSSSLPSPHLTVSPQDPTVVARLMGLGQFSKIAVVVALTRCQGNEEAAANLLLDQTSAVATATPTPATIPSTSTRQQSHSTTAPRRPPEPTPPPPPPPHPPADTSSSRVCVICMDAAITVALDPCGHAVLCEGCARACVPDRTCPICRQPFARVIRIYLP